MQRGLGIVLLPQVQTDLQRDDLRAEIAQPTPNGRTVQAAFVDRLSRSSLITDWQAVASDHVTVGSLIVVDVFLSQWQ